MTICENFLHEMLNLQKCSAIEYMWLSSLCGLLLHTQIPHTIVDLSLKMTITDTLSCTYIHVYIDCVCTLYMHIMYKYMQLPTMSTVEDEDQFAEFEVEGEIKVVHCLLQTAQSTKHCQTRLSTTQTNTNNNENIKGYDRQDILTI